MFQVTRQHTHLSTTTGKGTGNFIQTQKHKKDLHVYFLKILPRGFAYAKQNENQALQVSQ